MLRGAADSLKLVRHLNASTADFTRNSVLSACAMSEKLLWLKDNSGFSAIWLRIQYMATEKRIGARMHPCLTPDVVGNL